MTRRRAAVLGFCCGFAGAAAGAMSPAPVPVDYGALQLAFDVLQCLITAAIGVYVWISNKSRVTHARITKLEKDVDGRLDDHNVRLANIEAHMKHLPGHDDIDDLREKVSSLNGTVERLRGDVHGVRDALRPLQNVVALFNEFLLKAKIER